MDKEQQKVIKDFGLEVPIWTVLDNQKNGLKTVPRMTYYTKDGREIPNLPADPYSLRHYLSKGFTIQPPQPKEEIPVMVSVPQEVTVAVAEQPQVKEIPVEVVKKEIIIKRPRGRPKKEVN